MGLTTDVACVKLVWFYEHTNLYAHADEKCVPRIVSWVNLYIGRRYDAEELISSIEDNQVGYLSCKILPFLEVHDLERGEAIVKAFSDIDDFNAYCIISIEERLRRMREALRTAKEALMIERVAHAAIKKELEYLRALLIRMGRGDSAPGDEDDEGTMHAGEGRVCTSPGEDMHSFRTKIESANVGSGEDAQECDPFSEGMEPLHPSRRQRTKCSLHIVDCDTAQADAGDGGEEGVVRVGGKGSNSTIAKRIRRSPCRWQPSSKQVSPYVNSIAAARTGKCTMRNVCTSRKRSRKASSTTSKEQEVEDIGVAATEAAVEGMTVMAVVVPVAVAGSLDDGVGGIHDTVGHSEEEHKEEHLTKTKPVTERTTAAETIQTCAAGDAPIHQVHCFPFPMLSHIMVSLFHTLDLSLTGELHVRIHTHPLMVVYLVFSSVVNHSLIKVADRHICSC
ncbi:LOW QUALITY PROTEIN: hypothetical protein Cgig2_032813 [Carnegiea gigantea]|uniref:Uncharacterized protein n=1 Tax=Carnegiea gigantea TaxID=171969 RepID=A0A9Q1GR75_9CARY|nr:LOW QUALITY PROTEIN: hypothetical protein Cgig2_032813 [Carnegiea gigantea]